MQSGLGATGKPVAERETSILRQGGGGGGRGREPGWRGGRGPAILRALTSGLQIGLLYVLGIKSQLAVNSLY